MLASPDSGARATLPQLHVSGMLHTAFSSFWFIFLTAYSVSKPREVLPLAKVKALYIGFATCCTFPGWVELQPLWYFYGNIFKEPELLTCGCII